LPSRTGPKGAELVELFALILLDPILGGSKIDQKNGQKIASKMQKKGLQRPFTM
jgi:hypothetical protein